MDIRMKNLKMIVKNGLLLLAIFWLAGCKVQTQGLADLRDANGEPYSFAGATVSLYPLTAAAVTPGQSAAPLATGIVSPDGGVVMLSASRFSLRAERWLLVEFRCPADVPDDDCDVATPLHAVLTGANLRAGGWRATALTEAAFHSVAYGVLSGFTPAEIQQQLDETAHTLLGATYQDLLAWNPADTSALLRSGLLAPFSTALADGITHNDLKRSVQQWLSSSRLGVLPMEFAMRSDLVVDGAYAYRARSGGVDVVDVSDPGDPVLVSQVSISNMDWLRDVQFQDGFLYLTGENRLISPSHLRVVDVRDPLQPVLVSQIQLPREAEFFVVDGDYLYIGESYSSPSWSHGLTVWDIRNPQQPVQVASLPLQRVGDQAALVGQYLYLGHYEGLTIVDLSNPRVPVVAGEWKGIPVYGAMAVSGNTIYLSGTYNDIVVVDISEPLAPAILTTLEFDWLANVEYVGVVSALYSVGNDLYAVLGNGIHRIDVSNPAQPEWLGALDGPGFNFSAFHIQQGLLYSLGGALDGLQIMSLDALQRTPVLAGSLTVAGGVAGNADATTRAAYAPVGDYGTRIIDLRRPRSPTLLTTDRRFDHVLHIEIDQPYAFFADEYSFFALDISNPLAPVELPGTIPLQERGYLRVTGTEIVGDYAYLSARWGLETDLEALAVIDLKNPEVPVLASHTLIPFFSELIAATDDKLYTLRYVDGSFLQILDLENPLTPQEAGMVQLPDFSCASAAATGDYLYLACGNNGLLIVDASDSSQPAVIDTMATAGFATSIRIVNGHALLADSVAGIVLLDLANPAVPLIVGNAPVRGNARGAFLQNGLLYAGTSFGLDVLKAPRVLRD